MDSANSDGSPQNSDAEYRCCPPPRGQGQGQGEGEGQGQGEGKG